MLEVSDAVLELFLLVGADREDFLTGIRGAVVPLFRFKALKFLGRAENDSDIARGRLWETSNEPVPASGAVVGLLPDFVERASE